MSGADNPGRQNFDVNRNNLSLRSFATSLKKNLFEVWFYTVFFMILYMYTAPGQGLITPWRWNFDVNRNILSLRSFVASFKKFSLKSDYIHFFHDFIHVYSHGAGADSPQGAKFWFQQKCLVTPSIFLQVSKKCPSSLILNKFFHDLIHVYSPGAGVDSPQGTKFWCRQKSLITSPICCKFQRNFFEVWFYTIFSMI